jgi:hypothetical protein
MGRRHLRSVRGTAQAPLRSELSMTPPRMSHSRYMDLATCGEMYRLKRIERVPTTPSIYAINGINFHDWTDLFDSTPFPTEDHVHWWKRNLADKVTQAELDSGYMLREWDTPDLRGLARWQASPNKAIHPNQKAFEEFRDAIGPDMISKYIEWRKNTAWSAEHIELELTYQLGDVSGIAKIDRVFRIPETDELIAIDTKTWSRKRVTAQLPTYLVALRQNGFDVPAAAYYEARRGTTTDPKSYRYWDENRLAALHQQAAHMISMGMFLPAPGENCRMCDVRRHCSFALD